MLNKLFRDRAWEYLRVKEDGELEVQHYCSDYCGSNHYCCSARTTRIATTGRPSQTYTISVKTSDQDNAGNFIRFIFTRF